jgi:hypothetical protein
MHPGTLVVELRVVRLLGHELEEEVSSFFGPAVLPQVDSAFQFITHLNYPFRRNTS